MKKEKIWKGLEIRFADKIQDNNKMLKKKHKVMSATFLCLHKC